MKNWLGDLLFQMPVLELIHERNPNAAITCIAPERCREILEAHPAVSGFISFDEKSTHRSLFARIRLLWELQKAGPWDEGYLLHRSRSRALLLLLAGVKQRIGYRKGRRIFLTKAIPEPLRPMHQLDYFFNFAQAAGLGAPKERVYRFFYKEEDAAEASRILKEHGITISGSHCEEPPRGDVAIMLFSNKIALPSARNDTAKYICFHLGANWEPKRWPSAHFAALADMIHKRWQYPVVVTGSKNDEPLFQEFLRQVRNAKIIGLVGKTPLRVSAVIYKRSVCLVSGDSGPMHIASGVGAPVVALFGPTDPKMTGPRGTGDKIVLQHVPDGFQIPWYGGELPAEGWLSQITPEYVFDAVQRISPR